LQKKENKKKYKMKKTILLFAVIIFLSNISFAQAPDWLWAKSAGGTGDDFANSVVVDAAGNIYMAGRFESDTIIFDTITLTNASSFLAKYNANGNVIWAKSLGSADYFAMDVSGNIYVAGYFHGSSITFGSSTLTNAGGDDIFLAKYDANGNALWAKSAGGTITDWASSIAVDAFGNIYLAGNFSSPTLAFGYDTLTNAGGINNPFDIFIAKFDANGNVLWAKSAGGTEEDRPVSIAIDTSGNAYVTGFFYSSTITFGSTTLTNHGSANSADIFLAKYDANGNALWAKIAGGTSSDIALSGALNDSGSTYVAGYFVSPTISFGSYTLMNIGSGDLFLAKYDANGNVLWAKSAGGTSGDWANSIAMDASGNIYVAGYFASSTITFGYYTLTNMLGGDLFLAKYDANGNVLWAKNAGGTGDDDRVTSIAVDALGNTYMAGYFKSATLTFGSTTLTRAGDSDHYDIFLAKLCSNSGISELNNSLNISIFPNPSSDNTTIEAPKKSTIEILNIEGQIIKSISADENHTTIDISSFASGMYFVKIKSKEGIAVKKFVKE
jgi:hypothetical protein